MGLDKKSQTVYDKSNDIGYLPGDAVNSNEAEE